MNEGMWNDDLLDPWTEEEEHLSKMGVVAFGKGGGGGGQPAHTTQTTTSEYPTELKPFIKDIFGKAKGIEEARTTAGYQAYPAPRIAGFTPDQEAAFTGIREAQGLSSPFFGGATALTQRATRDFTPELSQQYMSPYAQNVIDIEQRELGRRGDVERQRIGAQAVGAGGFGGSRHAILEAEQARQQGQQASDIQTRGLQSAFQASQQAIAQQRQADLAGAGQMAQLGAQVPGQRFKELGALAGLGAAEQTQRQRALDLGYQQFRDEYNYPMQTLQDYSSVLRGFPLAPTQTQTGIAYSPVAPLSSQLLGAGTGALGMAGMAGMFGASGGHVAKLQQGGLASLYNRPSNRVRFGKTNYQGFLDYPEPLDTLSEQITSEPSDFKNIFHYLKEQAAGGHEASEIGIAKRDAIRARIEQERNTKLLEDLGKAEAQNVYGQYDLEKKYPNIFDDKKQAEITEAQTKAEEAAAKRKSIDDKRISRRERIAQWAPFLANAKNIMKAENPFEAFLGVGEAYGQGLIGVEGERDKESARRAGIRKASVDEAAVLAGIVDKLDQSDKITALSALAQNTLLSEEKRAFYSDQVSQILQKSPTETEEITRQISANINPTLLSRMVEKVVTSTDVAGDIVTESLFKASEQKTGGRVKLKEGGVPPIRSFDFVEKDGKIIATPI